MRATSWLRAESDASRLRAVYERGKQSKQFPVKRYTKNMKLKVAILIFIIGLIGLGLYLEKQQILPKDDSAQIPAILDYGIVDLKVRQEATFKDIKLKVVKIFDESRCPSDVTCIQMGTVKAEVESTSGLGTSTHILSLNSSFTTEAEEVTFIKATPYPSTKSVLQEEDYTLSFEVKKRAKLTLPNGTTTESCYIGGCSGEICSDSKDIVSTCIYKEQFACYKSAKCERQKSGLCGWTESKELQACLQSKEQS
jgi:hypothetical protein